MQKVNSKAHLTNMLDKKSDWEWGNEVLYRMCRDEPGHKSIDVIAGKVWLIGRSYAASLERHASDHMVEGENFYLKQVAPAVMESGIDKWLLDSGTIGRVTDENVEIVLDVHKKCTELFKTIAGRDRRSFVSKYLHFHQPNAFFIFDSQANNAIRKLLSGQRFKIPKGYDDQYAAFVSRCLRYRDVTLDPQLGRKSSPRELDRVLLHY